MADFKSGVSYYTKGQAIITVAFPENDVCCRWCPFCYEEKGLARSRCKLTNDIIYAAEFTIRDWLSDYI